MILFFNFSFLVSSALCSVFAPSYSQPFCTCSFPHMFCENWLVFHCSTQFTIRGSSAPNCVIPILVTAGQKREVSGRIGFVWWVGLRVDQGWWVECNFLHIRQRQSVGLIQNDISSSPSHKDKIRIFLYLFVPLCTHNQLYCTEAKPQEFILFTLRIVFHIYYVNHIHIKNKLQHRGNLSSDPVML